MESHLPTNKNKGRTQHTPENKLNIAPDTKSQNKAPNTAIESHNSSNHKLKEASGKKQPTSNTAIKGKPNERDGVNNRAKALRT